MLLLKLAFRNIFRQRRRSLLTAMSLAGGYILCVFSFSMSEGSYSNAISFFILDHTGHIQIHQEDYLLRPKIHKTIDDFVARSGGEAEKVMGFFPGREDGRVAFLAVLGAEDFGGVGLEGGGGIGGLELS